MKFRVTKTILSIFLIIYSCSGAIAQVSFSYLTPPFDHWYLESWWNIIIINSSDQPVDVYLIGTITEENAGPIAEGITSTFTVDAFYSGPLFSGDLTPLDVNYLGGKYYEETIESVGEFPTGKYTICVKVMDANSDQEMFEHCIEQSVFISMAPYLIFPAEGATLTEAYPMFIWSSASPGRIDQITYILEITETNDGQSFIEAIDANPLWFTEKDIYTTSFQLPISARELVHGQEYAWRVVAEIDGNRIGESEVWGFRYTNNSQIIEDSLIIDNDVNK